MMGEKTWPIILGANKNATLDIRCLKWLFWSFYKVSHLWDGVSVTKLMKTTAHLHMLHCGPKFQIIRFHLYGPSRLVVKTSSFGRVWAPLERTWQLFPCNLRLLPQNALYFRCMWWKSLQFRNRVSWVSNYVLQHGEGATQSSYSRAKFGRPGGARAGFNIYSLPLKLEGALHCKSPR